MTFYALCAIVWALRRRGLRGWLPLACVAGAALILFFPARSLIPAGVLLAAGLLDRPSIRRLAAMPWLTLILFLLAWRAIELAHHRRHD